MRLFLFLSLFYTISAYAQPANDNCADAFLIANPADFCSEYGEGTLLNATKSPQPLPNCLTGSVGDVWYKFTAIGPKMVFIVNGVLTNETNPTLLDPGAALYKGDCPNGLVFLACASTGPFWNIIELTYNNLVPGQTYYIRVSAVQKGLFRYCIRNFLRTDVVNGECATAIKVCDKDALSVNSVTNFGTDPTETDDCDCGTNESQSTWYVWTAADAGTLEFTITPKEQNDDIDFVLYELPNGQGNCAGKIQLRCMASGDWMLPSPCMGPTGLDATSIDITEDPNCFEPDDDAFLKYIDMAPGKTYALMISNFSQTGAGFDLTWGGAGTFQGTDADIFTDESDLTICMGEDLVVWDSLLSASDSLVAWYWDFGNQATTPTAYTQGPHTVQFQEEGMQTISLHVETAMGCKSTVEQQINVEFCCALEGSVAVTPGCPGDTGAVASVTFKNAIEPIKYTWSNGFTDSVAIFENSGNYFLTIQDATGCSDIVAFGVNTPLNYTFSTSKDTLILLGSEIPLTASLQPTGASPAIFTWTSPTGVLSGPTVAVSPQETTTYLLQIDAGQCKITDSVIVEVAKKVIEMPNAFTPNGDQLNDVFQPFMSFGNVVQMRIWSRWGELVYDGAGPWNGKNANGEDASSDIYVYHIEVRFLDGATVIKKGDITLLR